MKTIGSMCLAAVLASTMATVAMAEQQPAAKPADKPGAIAVSTKSVTAKVTAIDYKTRKVTLQGKDGESVELVVGPEAKNFDQVKKGDEVTFEYLESVAVVVTPKGATPPAAGQAAYVETAKPGEKPHGRAVQTTTITATVEAIDYKARTVTLKGPAGNVRTFTVGPEAKRFDEVKKGDQVTLNVTEAVAISVSKPEKKK
jgi:Cu/Ag efflux protein CusF